MKTFEAHSDGKVLVPDEPVELPAGTRYHVSAAPVDNAGEAEDGRSIWKFLLSMAGTAEGDYPPDLARNHDHYLHGRPKR